MSSASLDPTFPANTLWSALLRRFGDVVDSPVRNTAEHKDFSWDTFQLDHSFYAYHDSRNVHKIGGTPMSADTQEGKIELLVSDVIMPEMNGRQLFERLLLTRPTLKVLFMSGYTSNVIGHHGVLDEGLHFIQKPSTVQAMAEKVRSVLGSEYKIRR